MLQFTDEALILTVDKFGDHDAIVHVFGASHGLCRGVVKRGLSSKHRADVQPGNLVAATWKARLPEHMGTITLEARHSFAARVMHDPLRLSAVGSVLSLIACALAEHDAHPELYAQAVRFLQHVASGVAPLVWLGEYVRLELAVLEHAGFGLDLSHCAVTGQVDELAYVSPRSGRAVSRDAGKPYHDKMLALPDFIRDEADMPEWADVSEGMALTGYFITARLLPALHRHPLPLRDHFSQLLARKTAIKLAET